MKRLTGRVQNYAWGSTTAIPELLGRAPGSEPEAELWLGAHPSAPSRYGDLGLDAAVDAAPDLVGEASVAQFGPRLPFLLKVLAAAEPLSLQAHPSRSEAEAGFARESAAGVPLTAPERTYRDDWPKPEAICALGEFHGLCGFRDPLRTADLLEQLGVAELTELVDALRTGGSAALATVFPDILRRPEEFGALVPTVATAATPYAGDEGEFGFFCRTAVELAEVRPGDAGVIAALLTHRVVLQRYEALFLPAGNMHAYLHGLGVEIMANSDNVLRGGLTDKHVDVPELARLVDFTPAEPEILAPTEEVAGIFAYPTPAPEFDLWRIESRSTLLLPGDGGARIVLVVDGELSLESPGTLATPSETLQLARGESALVPAGELSVVVRGGGTAFVAAPGVR